MGKYLCTWKFVFHILFLYVTTTNSANLPKDATTSFSYKPVLSDTRAPRRPNSDLGCPVGSDEVLSVKLDRNGLNISNNLAQG